MITHEPSSPTYRRLGRTIERAKFSRFGFFRSTEEVTEAWNQTAAFARALGATWVVFQCPAAFRPTDENITNLRRFFSGMNRGGLHFAWEPRGDWPAEQIRRLCEEVDLVHCVDPFQNAPLYGTAQYFRLHGTTGYRYHYTNADFLKLLGWTRRKPSYVLFNNIAMKEDAQRFLCLLPESENRRCPG